MTCYYFLLCAFVVRLGCRRQNVDMLKISMVHHFQGHVTLTLGSLATDQCGNIFLLQKIRDLSFKIGKFSQQQPSDIAHAYIKQHLCFLTHYDSLSIFTLSCQTLKALSTLVVSYSLQSGQLFPMLLCLGISFIDSVLVRIIPSCRVPKVHRYSR